MNPPPILKVDRLSYAYPDGGPALTDVSFEVAPGECVGVLGANGAGKTTLFLLLVGILKPSAGTANVAGLNPFDSRDRRKLPEKIGIAFQNSDDQIFHATVSDDVAFGPLNLGCGIAEARERVADALRRVGLVGFEDRSPLRLSGGEKRRVALAGILAMRPEIILFDEPSVFLDARGRRFLAETIRSLNQTRLIASHDLELIRQTCGRVLLFSGGELVRDGAAQDVLEERGLMEEHEVM